MSDELKCTISALCFLWMLNFTIAVRSCKEPGLRFVCRNCVLHEQRYVRKLCRRKTAAAQYNRQSKPQGLEAAKAQVPVDGTHLIYTLEGEGSHQIVHHHYPTQAEGRGSLHRSWPCEGQCSLVVTAEDEPGSLVSNLSLLLMLWVAVAKSRVSTCVKWVQQTSLL